MRNKWECSDEHGKAAIMKKFFVQGMSTSEEQVLDRTHVVLHLNHMRSLLLYEQHEKLRKEMGRFGEGLKEMRETLEPK